MTDNELLLALSEMMDKKLKAELQPVKDDMQAIKDDIQAIKDDMLVMKDDIQVIKDDMLVMKDDIQVMKDRMDTMNNSITGINLHLENVTDNNIIILAENHLTLIDKLNQAINVSDKSLIYEIKVNFLTSKVEQLEKDMAEVKNKIA